jgi:cardiolipin synthase (CMP-forming)
VNLTLPNLLSLLRMALVPLFIVAVLEGYPGRALAVFAFAGITDALDGFIARFWKQQSTLGAYLDPAADKLLLVSAYVVLAVPNLHSGSTIPAWVSALVITRDVVIVVVALILHVASGVQSFPPSPISKVNTAVQVTAVILVLLSGVMPQVEIVAIVAVYLVAALTLASGIDYIYRSNQMVGET